MNYSHNISAFKVIAEALTIRFPNFCEKNVQVKHETLENCSRKTIPFPGTKRVTYHLSLRLSKCLRGEMKVWVTQMACTAIRESLICCLTKV